MLILGASNFITPWVSCESAHMTTPYVLLKPAQIVTRFLPVERPGFGLGRGFGLGEIILVSGSSRLHVPVCWIAIERKGRMPEKPAFGVRCICGTMLPAPDVEEEATVPIEEVRRRLRQRGWTQLFLHAPYG